MTAIQVHALVRAADRNARQVLAQAALLLDVAGRQQSVLRNTYPAWEIGREQDASGQAWWTAALRRPMTPELAAAGIRQTIRQSDAIALAATLAWQFALLHDARPRTGPY
ncbi:hypothetical protein [Nonomuraea sp. 10N515B]|uniref:hypothetical protein n=1 Tax=Nonomuraea sp. 10N515B TaxID=3457422 RepID=UPI003FCEA292